MAEPGLIEYVKEVVTKQAADLGPDGDVPPCLVYRNSTGTGVVLVLSFDSPEEKDEMALLMMASLMVDDAREAVFVSCVWTVSVVGTQETEERLRRGWDGPQPSEHPDRVEQILLAHCTVEDDDFHFAEIIRRPDAPPSLGDWDNPDMKGVGGRFADAVRDGLLLARLVPPNLRATLDGACVDPSERDDAIRGFMAALRKRVNH